MPPDPNAPPAKLSLIVFSDGYERVHYALALASSALAIGRAATLFFTMGGIRALIRADEDGAQGWRSLPGAERDEEFAAEGLATFEEMLAACVALGGKFLVCKMGLKAEGLTTDDLRPDVTVAHGGIVTFLNDARADGAMLMI
ncbi:MAG: hypothetical protein EXQ94_02070 [Alphaproteobacteria bacterium]|nr:hypothetical protein [Alphaproteobacteria bacterium]